MLWHNRGLYRALIFQQCSITILFSHIHTTKRFFSMDCRQADIEQQVSSGIDNGNSAYFIYTENPQDTLSWNQHSFPSGEWYIVITQLMQPLEQAVFPLYVISVQHLQDYKSKLNEAGMFHNIQLFSGSNPMTWRNAREAQAHHQKTCKCFCICSRVALPGEKK